MCDASSIQFFRPWNGVVAQATEEASNREVKNSAIINNNAMDREVGIDAIINNNRMDREFGIGATVNNNAVDCEVYDRVSKESMESDSDDDDNDSLISSLSSASSETGSCHRRRSDSPCCSNKFEIRPSGSSSCSVNIRGDLPEAGSLNMLRNFVLGTRSNEETAGSKIESFMATSSNPSSEASSDASRSSPKSAFTPPSYQHRRYSAFEYFSPLGPVGPTNAVITATAAAVPFGAACSFPSCQQLLPAVAIDAYMKKLDAAVREIYDEDTTVKQMKKLRPKKFRCEHCGVAFSNNGQLKGHLRIHTGERPFKCDAEGCGKSFTRNEELTRHKRIHTGLRPHSCIECGKRFGRKDHLKKHTRTHENRMSYHIPTSAMGPFPYNHHAFPQAHPMASYIYPILEGRYNNSIV